MNFFTLQEIIDLQQSNIERFGGSPGLRDQGALESALMAAENREHYEDADFVQCAAAYGFHLCQAHAFIDGNKRIAATACFGFLRFNGFDPQPDFDEAIDVFMRIASSEMSRDELETWLRPLVK